MSDDSGTDCKVDRVSAKYGLTELDARLKNRWEEGESLRDLETFYNEAVLRSAMESAGMDALDGEVSNLYQLLTADDVGSGERVDARARLERNGIDPSVLTADFVSYQTVRTHLNDCLEIATSREKEFGVEDARNTVLKLVSRTELVTRRTLERLANHGTLTVPEPSVTMSLRVACAECGDEYAFSRLLDRGGCSCQTADSATR